MKLAWVLSSVIGVAGSAHAQKATEVFTPIGESPGLSGKVTVIGTISAVDEASRTCTVTSNGEEFVAEITEDTKIYLDKTPIQQTSTEGERSDLKTGARVELLYEGRTRSTSGPLEWIKIEVTQSR